MMMLAVPVTEAFVQQHVGALQLLALDHEELVGDVEVEFRAELLESDEVGVEPAAADLVAARLGMYPTPKRASIGPISMTEPRRRVQRWR